MKKWIVAVLCVVMTAPAAATQKKLVTESMTRSENELGKGTMFREQKKDKKETPALPDKDCQYLTAYVPSAEGDAEYKPGVGADGKPVMEADLNPSAIQVPEKIGFDLTVDVAKYLGIETPTGTLSEAKIGTITVEKGRVMFNGKPMEGEEEAALRALCASEKPKESPK